MPAITCVITVDAERTRARLPKHLLVCRWLSLNGTQKSKYSFWFYFFLLPSSCLLQERFWIVSEIKNLWLFQFWECPAVCVVYDRNWTWLVFVCCGFFHFTYTFVSLLVCSLIHWSCYFVKMIMKSVTLLCYCCWITLLFSSVFACFFSKITNRQVVCICSVLLFHITFWGPNTTWMTFPCLPCETSEKVPKLLSVVESGIGWIRGMCLLLSMTNFN